MQKRVFIVGGNFNNKGAQSMLFITIDELKKRIPNCEIFFASAEIYNENDYVFKRIYFSQTAQKIGLQKEFPAIQIAKGILRDCIKWVVGKRNNLWRFMEVRNIMPDIDLMVDISGYSLGNKWSTKVQKTYLNNIRLAKKYDIPIYMMPQSFGPFNYNWKQYFLKKQIQILLSYPQIVFVREKQGLLELQQTFHLQNLALSTDLVLQNKGVNIKNIYAKEVKMNIPCVCSANAVGIIPNAKCFSPKNEERNMNLYRSIISELLLKGKKVYVIRHSEDDIEVCKKIAKCIDTNDSVFLVENNLSCMEFEQLVKHFEFIICSRYHGIVHAYRNLVPCLVLGWAVKYIELCENLEQEQYAFDITADICEHALILQGLKKLMEDLHREKIKIREKLGTIQNNNCFECISQWAMGNE